MSLGDCWGTLSISHSFSNWSASWSAQNSTSVSWWEICSATQLTSTGKSIGPVKGGTQEGPKANDTTKSLEVTQACAPGRPDPASGSRPTSKGVSQSPTSTSPQVKTVITPKNGSWSCASWKKIIAFIEGLAEFNVFQALRNLGIFQPVKKGLNHITLNKGQQLQGYFKGCYLLYTQSCIRKKSIDVLY